jgi:hypothetical protein
MQSEPNRTSTDLTLVANEPGNNLRDRFSTLLTNDTRHFDCLVGYFYISGFHKIYPALGNVEKVRILVVLPMRAAASQASILDTALERTTTCFQSPPMFTFKGTAGRSAVLASDFCSDKAAAALALRTIG